MNQHGFTKASVLRSPALNPTPSPHPRRGSGSTLFAASVRLRSTRQGAPSLLNCRSVSKGIGRRFLARAA